MHHIDPLEADSWFRAIESLSERTRRSPALEGQLRHAYHLLQMAPLPIREVLDPACDEARFEGFLACDAFESAALALMPPPLKVSIARGTDAMVLASVAFPGDDSGAFASSEHCSSALLQAWTRSLLALQPRNARPLRVGGTAGASDPGWSWLPIEPDRRSTGT